MRVRWGPRRRRGGRCVAAALQAGVGGGGCRASRGFQVRGRPRALVPPFSCLLYPLTGDFCRPQGCGWGRGTPAFGGAGAAGCAGTRRRPLRPVPPALPWPLAGADSLPGFPALLTLRPRRAAGPRRAGPRRELVLSTSPRCGQ